MYYTPKVDDKVLVLILYYTNKVHDKVLVLTLYYTNKVDDKVLALIFYYTNKVDDKVLLLILYYKNKVDDKVADFTKVAEDYILIYKKCWHIKIYILGKKMFHDHETITQDFNGTTGPWQQIGEWIPKMTFFKYDFH